MTHEPECPIGNNNAPLTFYAARQNVAIVCVCSNIRAAYQRGREDAAKALVAFADDNLLPTSAFGVGYNPFWNRAIAAARGDGEPA